MANGASTVPNVNERTELPGKLKLSQRKVDELIALGEIDSFTVGKRRFVTDEALAAFIRKRQRASK